ncbi:unnamed protein product, partial [Effrenium voratum]
AASAKRRAPVHGPGAVLRGRHCVLRLGPVVPGLPAAGALQRQPALQQPQLPAAANPDPHRGSPQPSNSIHRVPGPGGPAAAEAAPAPHLAGASLPPLVATSRGRGRG